MSRKNTNSASQQSCFNRENKVVRQSQNQTPTVEVLYRQVSILLKTTFVKNLLLEIYFYVEIFPRLDNHDSCNDFVLFSTGRNPLSHGSGVPPVATMAGTLLCIEILHSFITIHSTFKIFLYNVSCSRKLPMKKLSGTYRMLSCI